MTIHTASAESGSSPTNSNGPTMSGTSSSSGSPKRERRTGELVHVVHRVPRRFPGPVPVLSLEDLTVLVHENEVGRAARLVSAARRRFRSLHRRAVGWGEVLQHLGEYRSMP